jgi:hypothetical protein
LADLTNLGIILLYCVGLLIAYNRGERVMKRRYTKLIRSLHIQYNQEMNAQSDLLSELYDMEDFTEYQKI